MKKKIRNRDDEIINYDRKKILNFGNKIINHIIENSIF